MTKLAQWQIEASDGVSGSLHEQLSSITAGAASVAQMNNLQTQQTTTSSQLADLQVTVQAMQATPATPTSGTPLQYVEIDDVSTSIAAGATATLDIPFPANVQGVNIKTVLVQAQTSGAVFTVVILNQDTGGRVLYKSNQVSNVLYDMIDLPYKDGAGANQLHLQIQNTGAATIASAFTIIITGIGLI